MEFEDENEFKTFSKAFWELKKDWRAYYNIKEKGIEVCAKDATALRSMVNFIMRKIVANEKIKFMLK